MIINLDCIKIRKKFKDSGIAYIDTVTGRTQASHSVGAMAGVGLPENGDPATTPTQPKVSSARETGFSLCWPRWLVLARNTTGTQGMIALAENGGFELPWSVLAGEGGRHCVDGGLTGSSAIVNLGYRMQNTIKLSRD